jgi:hypothetical protein
MSATVPELNIEHVFYPDNEVRPGATAAKGEDLPNLRKIDDPYDKKHIREK